MTEPVAKDVEDEQKDKEKEKRKWLYLAPIAKPLVTKKLNKKALKVVKKGIGAVRVQLLRRDRIVDLNYWSGRLSQSSRCDN